MLVLVTALGLVAGTVIPANASELQSCANGSTYTLDTLPGGGTIERGLVGSAYIEIPHAPAGFDPVSSSDEDLAEFGIQARPADGSDESLETWLAVARIQAAANEATICDLAEQNAMLSDRAFAVPNPNWGGYVAKEASPSYIGVAAQWVEPTYVADSAGCSASQAGIWVGVGGYQSKMLLQAGTAVNTTGVHYAWFEWISPSNSVSMQPFANSVIRSGDTIYTYVSASQSASQVTFSVTNLTRSLSYVARVTMTPIGSFLDGTSAEVIVERLALGSVTSTTYADLANFGTLDFSSAQVQLPDGTYRTLRVAGPTQLTITNAASQPLELTYSMGSATSFRTVFQRCS